VKCIEVSILLPAAPMESTGTSVTSIMFLSH